ncbi:MAG TPA: HAD family hydrolase [Pseudolabrys sp.]|nr:HAD family hydrolase [Hyphomicrobiales bacterium]MBN9041547.1 HAD family hydrolase [Hyphomicrobiales bacterium]OJY12890.1 MAG: hydrolase [Rhizobiales bacterium 62-47]
MRYDLIIFDCDGVLVDSEVISCQVHAEMLTAHGYPISAEDVHARFLGRSARAARDEVEAELGHPLPEAYGTEIRALMTRRFTELLQPVAAIHETLAALTLPMCVASSGTLERVQSSLRITALHDRFAPHIFSATQVRHGKPAPDLFLFAAAQMAVPAARCLVIEDSVPGITGARAAGMTVFGFHGGSHCRPDEAARLQQAGAEATFNDMRQLPGMIQ